MAGFRTPGRNRELITVTGTTCTVTADDAGKTYCNVGASGAFGATIASAATFRPGDDVLFLSCADQNFVVTGTSGELIVLNDIAANSVALQTSSEKAGGGFLFTCVGAKWHVSPLAEETQTVTVAT